MSVKVSNHSMRLLVDNGVSINVIDEQALATFKTKPTLAKASTYFFAYASDAPMTTLGVFHAEIASMRMLAEAKMYVVVRESCGSLSGYRTARDLGSMKINVIALHSRYDQPTTAIDALEKNNILSFSTVSVS